LEPGIAARITALSEPLGPLIVADYFVQQHERTGDDGVGRILFFGFIRPYKGLDTLLRATRILLDDGYPVQLNVVGRPVGEFDAYNALIAKLSLGEHVNLELRWVSDYEAAQYFKLSNIVVLPYRDAPEIDASGVLHLAAAARRVIVVTTVGGLGERVRDGTSGFVCRPDDPDDLARALRNALSLSATESEIITTTAHAAFGLAGAWTDLAGRLTDLYQRALRSADG
jgi:glycosyltransferase involved in cell wall biosynthesis